MDFFIALPPEGEGASKHVAPVPNIVRIHDMHPGMPRRFHDMFRELMYRSGPLHRWQRELIATVVSAENDCHY